MHDKTCAEPVAYHKNSFHANEQSTDVTQFFHKNQHSSVFNLHSMRFFMFSFRPEIKSKTNVRDAIALTFAHNAMRCDAIAFVFFIYIFIRYRSKSVAVFVDCKEKIAVAYVQNMHSFRILGICVIYFLLRMLFKSRQENRSSWVTALLM